MRIKAARSRTYVHRLFRFHIHNQDLIVYICPRTSAQRTALVDLDDRHDFPQYSSGSNTVVMDLSHSVMTYTFRPPSNL